MSTEAEVLESLRVQILRAEPGDVVVLTTERTMSKSHADAVLRAMRAIPRMEGVSVAVMDRGLHVDSVIRPA